ncbi:MAG: serine protease Do [Actinomycetota bacterium]|nr:serine protease Do [Actinomycetota bacterium]
MPRRLLIFVLAIVALSATACTLTYGSTATSPNAQIENLPPLPPSAQPVEAVVRRVLPSVVSVTTDLFQSNQFGSAQEGQGVGTGFIVRSDGIIVTNCHVVEGATGITVATSADHPKKYSARVIGGDCEHDVAILKIDASGLPTVQLGSSADLQLGESVVALGYALALDGGPTVTNGIVSSLHRTIKAQDPGCTTCSNGVRTYSDIIQTDAAINHGNSGGPLVDMNGRVVGMNSAGVDSAQNIGFAIAIDSFKSIVTHAESDPLAPTGYLGIDTQSVTAAIALQLNLPVKSGAFILGTTNGGPAEKAGIKEGDVIVSVNGHPISVADDLTPILQSLKPGTTVSVVLVRKDGSRATVQVTLGERPLPTQLP